MTRPPGPAPSATAPGEADGVPDPGGAVSRPARWVR